MKRKRVPSKKLQLGEKVEVRSTEAGFEGSWHPGEVIQCKELERHIKYDNILVDNGVDYLVEIVSVSEALDGHRGYENCYERGSIRPVPAMVDFEKWDLRFGLCVDAYVDEVWWEGVIFDHCDGMEERKVFFPDQGDEMQVGMREMRITQDWDEVTEEWAQRGKWVFLELVEKWESKLFVTVSPKQIWYDVRIRKEFEKIGEWTCNMEFLWKNVVKDVINDYLSLTVEEVLLFLNLPGSLSNKATELESVEVAMANGEEFQKQNGPYDTCEVVPGASCFEESREHRSSIQLKSNYWKHLKFSEVEPCPDAVEEYLHASNRETKAFWMNKLQKHLVYLGWKIEWTDRDNKKRYKYTVPDKQGQKFYLSLIEVCRVMTKDLEMNSLQLQNDQSIMKRDLEMKSLQLQNDQSIMKRDLEMNSLQLQHDQSIMKRDLEMNSLQLQHDQSIMKRDLEMNSLQLQNDQSIMKRDLEMNSLQLQHDQSIMKRDLEMNSLQLQHDQSIMKRDLEMNSLQLQHDQSIKIKGLEMNSLQLQNDQSTIHPTVDCHISDLPLNPSENVQSPDILPPTVPSSPVEDEVEDEPEFCPEAVERYYQSHLAKKNRAYKRKLIPKAKKHLLAVGWIFDYPPPTNKKRGIIYMSPQNRKFSTLHGACLSCIKETKLSGMQSVNVSGINEESVDRVQGGELVCKPSQWLPKDTEFQAMDGGAASRSIANRKRKRLRDSKANTPKCKRAMRVLRSNKRVQKVSNPSPLHHKPLNVLSCLIDSGIIVPRSKVYYKAKGRQRAVCIWAVGRITGDGIKCDCCLKIYSFVGFEKHAVGRSTCKPSANIFLEDKRSLLDCQIEMMQGHRTRETSGKSPSDLSLTENDYICSVCNYGGDLILCDQCPSSFHKDCLCLEDIPDGDWFCPSCRCRICGQSKIDGDEDKHFVTCVQCEHKYHVRCLNNGSVDISRYHGNWFCGEDCEKIYEGLQKLLGEPVSVGVDNLTWTLVKYINPDSCDSESMAESYSKLNLALSVMHECFEPLKESITSRDLVEDVIFSRRSDLNRLNFQGFYTVLLEKDEELISVATVRVYGKKVAELPLVGTRLQYRRHGMCRILINELEKMLKQLDVERLVLPAVPSVLETWTGSFGFVKMTDSERSQFLDYTFLDFQGTIMCQKPLMDIPSPDTVLLVEPQSKFDVSSRSCCVNFSKSSSVYQVEEIDKIGMVDQQMEDVCAGNNDQVIGAIHSVTMVEQPCRGECQGGTTSSQSSKCLIDKQVDKNNELYKFFYSRRKLRKTCKE